MWCRLLFWNKRACCCPEAWTGSRYMNYMLCSSHSFIHEVLLIPLSLLILHIVLILYWLLYRFLISFLCGKKLAFTGSQYQHCRAVLKNQYGNINHGQYNHLCTVSAVKVWKFVDVVSVFIIHPVVYKVVLYSFVVFIHRNSSLVCTVSFNVQTSGCQWHEENVIADFFKEPGTKK